MDSHLPPAPEQRPPMVPPPEIPRPLPPPPLRTAPPARPPQNGRGWKYFSLVLLLVLVVVVFFNFTGFLGRALTGSAPAGTTASRLEEITVEDNSSADKIAVIQVKGVITGSTGSDGNTTADLIQAQLKRAAEDNHVKAVLLKVDSPGGEVLASDDIYRAIVKFQDDTHKSVIASMGSLAASGGYYISAPCHAIVANELTITGSIGVIMHALNYRGLMDKVGLQPEVFKSGKFKDMLSGEKDLNNLSPEEQRIHREEQEMVQTLIDETYGRFKKIVGEGRTATAKANPNARKLAADWTNYADGRILTGKQAYDLGFVDDLGDFDQAVKVARKIAGIDSANLVEYQIPFNLGNLLHLSGKTEAPAIKVDLGMDFPRLQIGRLYFMSPTVVH